MSAADRLLIKPRRWARPAPAPSTTGHFQGTHGQHDHESVDSTGADPYGEPTRNATPHSQHDHRKRGSGAGGGDVLEQTDERPHDHPGAALRRVAVRSLAVVGRARDVEVSPRDLLL